MMSLHNDISINDWTDDDINDYLNKLDVADLEVSQWEADFIGNNLDRKRFSPKQREVVRKLFIKYGEDF